MGAQASHLPQMLRLSGLTPVEKLRNPDTRPTSHIQSNLWKRAWTLSRWIFFQAHLRRALAFLEGGKHALDAGHGLVAVTAVRCLFESAACIHDFCNRIIRLIDDGNIPDRLAHARLVGHVQEGRKLVESSLYGTCLTAFWERELILWKFVAFRSRLPKSRNGLQHLKYPELRPRKKRCGAARAQVEEAPLRNAQQNRAA